MAQTNIESAQAAAVLPSLPALYPVNQKAETADPDTREFLLAVVKILLDFITDTNDRDTKVVDFHHPIEMRKKLDLAISDKPRPLDSLLEDCKMALENQVKTGELSKPPNARPPLKGIIHSQSRVARVCI